MAAETSATAERRLLRSALFLHRLATHGESPEAAADRRRDWDAHLRDLADDGRSDLGLLALAMESLLVHVGWRFRHGTPTAIPAGLLVTLLAAAALAFSLTSETHYPPEVHAHIALGLLGTGLVFLRWPLGVPNAGLASIGLLVGSSMIHGLSTFRFERPSDALLASGAVMLVVGSSALLLVALGRGRRSGLRRRGFETLALGTVLFSLGNLTGYQIADEPSYALTSLFSASMTMLAANAIMRVRDIC